MPRGSCNRVSLMDRSRTIGAANDGSNWQFGVNYKTAYIYMVCEDRDEIKQKRRRERICTNEQVNVLVVINESDSTLTFRQLSKRSLTEFGVHVSASNIHNYLQKKLITLKKAHELRVKNCGRVKTMVLMMGQTLAC